MIRYCLTFEANMLHFFTERKGQCYTLLKLDIWRVDLGDLNEESNHIGIRKNTYVIDEKPDQIKYCYTIGTARMRVRRMRGLRIKQH